MPTLIRRANAPAAPFARPPSGPAARPAACREALHSKGPSGLPPRLSDADLERLATALGHGAGAHGFTGEVWTLRRIAQVVEREFGCTTTWGICGRSCPSSSP